MPRIIAVLHDTTDQSFENKASVVFVDEIFILPFWSAISYFSLLEIRQWEVRLQSAIKQSYLCSPVSNTKRFGYGHRPRPPSCFMISLIEKNKTFPTIQTNDCNPQAEMKIK